MNSYFELTLTPEGAGTRLRVVESGFRDLDLPDAERAQWASEIANEPMAQQNAQLADDYTEFNGDFQTLLVGKTMATRMGEVTPYDRAMFSE